MVSMAKTNFSPSTHNKIITHRGEQLTTYITYVILSRLTR